MGKQDIRFSNWRPLITLHFLPTVTSVSFKHDYNHSLTLT